MLRRGEWERFKVDYDPATLGKWEIRVANVGEAESKRHNTSEAIQALQHGTAMRPVKPGTYRQLIRDNETIVMSDTEHEIKDSYPVFDFVSYRNPERILINGLGLGIVPRGILSMSPTVEIDIVELDMEVVALTGAQFFNNPQVHIYHGDALTMKWPPKVRWDLAWHDIWDFISVDNYEDMKTLHRKYQGRVGLQLSWSKREVLQHRRRWGM